jgi:hypothetical protein
MNNLLMYIGFWFLFLFVYIIAIPFYLVLVVIHYIQYLNPKNIYSIVCDIFNKINF